MSLFEAISNFLKTQKVKKAKISAIDIDNEMVRITIECSRESLQELLGKSKKSLYDQAKGTP